MIFGIVAAVSLSVCAFVAYSGLPGPIQARIDILPDKSAKAGTLHTLESAEVESGNFWVVLNQLPTMEAGSWDCNIEYENPAENKYSARISLYMKEDGKLLGNTRRVDPGNYVETIRLKRNLPAGEYPVLVNLELFEKKTPVGTMSIDMILRVTGQGEGAR